MVTAMKVGTWTLLVVCALVAAACMEPRDPPGGPCTDGDQRCNGGAFEVCRDGHFVIAERCPITCVDTLGCVECVPGSTTCEGEDAHICRNDGSGYDPFVCDPLQGLSCDVDAHTCSGACLPTNLDQSNVGCNYFATVTGNEVRSEFEFAVIISNVQSATASVHIEGGGLAAPMTFDVAGGAVHVQALPWVDQLKACEATGVIECGNPQNGSALVRRGAYHIRSTQPVTVYQYNPLDYGLPSIPCTSSVHEGCSYSNDAALLLPVHTLTGNFYASSWQNWFSRTQADFPGFVSITATRDNTTVTVTTTGNTLGGPELPPFTPGMPGAITLNEGDVAQLFARRLGVEPVDLTGTRITADAPIQVIGGHYCTETIGMACDHMEESMLPVEVLGTRYIVSAPEAAPHQDFWGEQFHIGERYLRIIATEPDTTITYDPPSFRLAPGQVAPTYLANAGDVGEIVYAYFRDSVEIRANKKVLVTEYMVGGQTSNIGDPAMAVAVPVEQYRLDYSFHAPKSYDQNYVNVVAPLSAIVSLDGGAPLTGFEPIGGTGFGLLRVLLDNGGTGTHKLTGTQPFGITVYGYGAFTSYWYAGGLDLHPIVVE